MDDILFVDTDAFLSYFSSKDPHHKKARRIINAASKIIITDYLYDEILTLARRRLGIEPSIQIMHYIGDNRDIEIIIVAEKDKNIAKGIFEKYKDKDFSFTDCTSFAVIQRLGFKNILSFDKHFQQYGISTL